MVIEGTIQHSLYDMKEGNVLAKFTCANPTTCKTLHYFHF